MRIAFLSAAALLLSACTLVPTSPVIESQREVARQGALVPLLQPVQLGRVVLTPMRVTEDSRCPADVQCVTAGRVIVDTRIDGPGWRQTQPLVLGEPHSVRGITVTLAGVEPAMRIDPRLRSADYRLRYAAE